MKAYDIESEQLILASILLDNKALARVRSKLSVDDFAIEKHRLLFEVFCDVIDKEYPLEPTVIVRELEKVHKLDLAGGKAYLFDLAEMATTTTTIDYYISALRDHNAKFKLFELATRIDKGVSNNTGVDDLVEDIKGTLSTLRGYKISDSPLSQSVRGYIESTSGMFLSTDVYNCLQLSTRNDKKNVHIILRRLSKEGLIEKTGSRTGQYRRVEKEAEEIHWKTFEGQDLDFRFPLGIHRWIKIYPKSLFVFAGAPDSGKSAFAFNLIFLNQGRFKTHYFTSEMGPQELKSRLEKFDELGVDEWKFIAKERATDFADVIQPDDLNIIDFLQIHDNFYLIARQLADIYAKLKEGIAVVFIQKAPGASLGRGKSFSLETPRLYCTLDKHVLKIVKAKNWRDSDKNPNNQTVRYKIVAGCKIFQDSDWKYED